ncbi:MAG: hypothetical protein ACRERV_00155 [Methylococcales bacterium]
MLAKMTAKNQLTPPKAASNACGPTDYFEKEKAIGQSIPEWRPTRRSSGTRQKAPRPSTQFVRPEKTREGARCLEPAPINTDIAANLDAFKARREMIVHEDQLINARLTTLLFAQSFLVTAAVILLANARPEVNGPAFYWLTLIISVLSMLLGVLTSYSISAARLAQENVRSATAIHEEVFPFQGENPEKWRRCLQSHTVFTLAAGFGISLWVPRLTTIAWVSFGYYCVLRISDDGRLAVVASLATVFILLAAFAYVHRMFKGDKVISDTRPT